MSASHRAETRQTGTPTAAWGVTRAVSGQPSRPWHSYLLAARAQAQHTQRLQETRFEADLAGMPTSRTPQA